MRVLLTSVGSSGDINPFIALGRELMRRGHTVTLLVNPYFEGTVRAAGLAYEALGEYLSPVDLVRERPEAFGRFRGPMELIRGFLVPMVPELVRATRSAAERLRPEVIVCHQISFGVPWVARERGIPFVTAVLSPSTLLSVESPSVYQFGWDVTRMPGWCRRMYSWQARKMVSWIIDRPLKVIRREMGVPACDDTFFGEMLSGGAVVGLWSSALRGAASDDAENLTICGYAWHDRSALHGERGERLDARLERFLEAGDAPVVFTLGSVLSHEGAREFEAAAGACELLGCRGVLVTGGDRSAPSRLPPGVMAVDYAPYGLLMDRGCATVHHGGAGTTGQALRAGRPMVVMPFAHDQFDHAARVSRMGAGVWLARRRGGAEGLARTLRRVLDDGEMKQRSAEVGARVRAERGVETAAERIEACVR
ncbi:MAG: glycosyltransferase family 1 protein [Phycisphaerae bacterium]|nr:glycosyltransferase family 1 protein [Phycisphaerae bacterium]